MTLAGGGFQPRTAVVREVVPKYVYRFRDCMDQFQIRFPGAPGCEVVRLGSGEAFDPTPLVRAVEARRRHVRELEDAYRTGPLPLTTFAVLAGRDEFEARGHLSSDPTLGIRCASGHPRDIAEGHERVRTSRTLVLDITALITLATLDLLPVLGRGGRRYVVSQATAERVRDLLTWPDFGDGEGLRDDGRPGTTDARSAPRERFQALRQSIHGAVRDHCEVRPCPEAAALDPGRRDAVADALGGHNLEALLLAAAPGAAIWSDDLVVGVVGRTEFGAGRVWTQAVLHVSIEDGVLTADEYHRATAKLVGRNYHGTRCGPETLVGAAEVAGWDTTGWPVPEVMRTLGGDAADPAGRVGAASAAVRAVWRRDLPDHTRQGFLFAVLSGLGSVRLIGRLTALVPPYFFLDVLATDRVVGLIRCWLRHPTGIVRP